MALFTKRNHVKPMFGFVAKIMVVTFGGLAAIVAAQSFGGRDFMAIYSVAYQQAGTVLSLMSVALSFLCRPAFGTLVVSPVAGTMYGVAFRALVVSSNGDNMTFFALAVKFLMERIPIKVVQRLNSVAFRAAFCLNCFRHFVSFPNIMFRASRRNAPAGGSFYCIKSKKKSKH